MDRGWHVPPQLVSAPEGGQEMSKWIVAAVEIVAFGSLAFFICVLGGGYIEERRHDRQ